MGVGAAGLYALSGSQPGSIGDADKIHTLVGDANEHQPLNAAAGGGGDARSVAASPVHPRP